MKYKTEIEIDLPRQNVIDIYSNDFLTQHTSLKEHNLINGECGKVNAKYLAKTGHDGRIIEFHTTIVKNEKPDELWTESYRGNDFKKLRNYS